MVALCRDLQAILLISRSRLFQISIPLTLNNARAKNVFFLYLGFSNTSLSFLYFNERLVPCSCKISNA